MLPPISGGHDRGDRRPVGIRSIARMRACLVSGRIVVCEDEGAIALCDLDLLVERAEHECQSFLSE
jgi:hypothetical protein